MTFEQELKNLKKLAGGESFKGLTPYSENLSYIANKKSKYMKKKKIQPGSPKWFKLWFAQPGLTGEDPFGT